MAKAMTTAVNRSYDGVDADDDGSWRNRRARGDRVPTANGYSAKMRRVTKSTFDDRRYVGAGCGGGPPVAM